MRRKARALACAQSTGPHPPIRHLIASADTHPRSPASRRPRVVSGRAQELDATMPVVRVKDNESFEVAMKRFKKTCEKAGILTELRRREYYDKPSIRKKKKAAAARKRALKKMRRMSR